LNQTAPRFMTQELDRNHCIHGCPQKSFHGGQLRNFAYPFQVADDAVHEDFYKTLYSFYPISLCCGWTSILNFLSVMFSTLRLSTMLFLFIKCQYPFSRTVCTIML